MNRPISTGLKLDFCSYFVLIFPPNICEIGQAVPEISISKATRLVQKELLDWTFKNGYPSPLEISIQYSESEIILTLCYFIYKYFSLFKMPIPSSSNKH